MRWMHMIAAFGLNIDAEVLRYYPQRARGEAR